MDPEYGRRYRTLFRQHWWWRARRRRILDVLEELRPAGGWSCALDVGCGDGLFFDELRSFAAHIEGVEPDADLVSSDVPSRGLIHVRPFDASFRPEHRYGLILMLDVLEHLEDPRGALRHAVRLLEPRGTLLVTVPAFRWLWTNHDVINHHRTRYDRPCLRALAEGSGVEVTRMEYFFHWTVPAKLLIRAWEAVLRPEPTYPTLPPRWLNGLLLRLTRLEQVVLGPLHLPFGSSLMMVGGRREA